MDDVVFEKTQHAQSAPCPLFIYLDGASVVVVGAGSVAERKVEWLLSYGACVKVIAPQVTSLIQKLASDQKVTLVQRTYISGDTEGALFVVCATNDRAVNEHVFNDAHARGQLVNVVDVPDLCNAIVPSTLKRGPLQIAVSTAGCAPSVARDIRHDLEDQYPAYWEEYVELLGDVRLRIKQRVAGSASARTPLYGALAQSDVLARIVRGEHLNAEDVYDTYIAPLIDRSI